MGRYRRLVVILRWLCAMITCMSSLDKVELGSPIISISSTLLHICMYHFTTEIEIVLNNELVLNLCL